MKENIDFWNDPCGSQAAKALGISDINTISLKKFDEWYMKFYPYLYNYIPFSKLKNKNVLEIGLGYGTISQKIAQSGANYTGLDIAETPVAIVNYRLKINKLEGIAIQGNILEHPFKLESFDMIIAIGCLHHTGNLKLSIENCYNLLKKNGCLIMSVYYAYSYRRFMTAPKTTLKYFIKELFGYRGVVGESSPSERGAYDQDTKGNVAPYTDWISIKSLKKLFSKFSRFSGTLENIDSDFLFSLKPRKKLLTTIWPRIIGLDLYVIGIK